MKPIRILITLLLALVIVGKVSAQLSIVIFAENGEKFTAFINGDPKNDKPASRVEADRPGGPSFKVRISFEDRAIPDIQKTIFNSPGSDMYYVIRSSSHGKLVLEKTTYEYAHSDKEASPEPKGANKDGKGESDKPKSEPKQTGGSGTGKGCPNPMDEPSFIASREMISSGPPFDGPKLTHAKNLAEKHCLTTSQIIEVIYIFSGESSKLSFAKFAYRHCYDPGNYGNVKDVLRSSSQDDLQRYIDSFK